MRPIEILLSLANLLAFVSLIIPLSPALPWMRYAAFISLIIAVLQGVVEGARWQMVPAYLLALVFCLIALAGNVTPNALHVNRVFAGIGVGLAVLGILVSIVLPIVLPVFHFPKPTGPYAIGTTTYHWVDTDRPELFTTDPNDQRELMAQVWYPAKDEPSAPRAPYIQDAESITPALARLTHLPVFLFSHFKYVTTNAVADAPVAQDQAQYPVLIFLSGLNGFRQMNMFQIEELVSQGYIIVGLAQPGAVALVHFPDVHDVSGLPRDLMYPLIQQSVEPLPTTPTLFGKALPDGIVPYFAADVPFTL
ncbi:MAG: carboxylic ester hydrolase, partial [Chloroflexota bacterium]